MFKFKRPMAYILLFAIIGLVIYLRADIADWIRGLMSPETKNVDVGFSGVARYNPLLALERTMNALDVETVGVRRYADIKPAQYDVVLLRSIATLSEASSEQWIDWVAQGGHLIFAADSALQDNSLLQRLGVTVVRAPTTSLRFAKPLIVDTEEGEFHVRFRNADLSSEGQELYWSISDAMGVHVLHYLFDNGHITVFSDIDFLSNQYLAYDDHADFFYWLVEQDDPYKLWLQYLVEFPSLWRLLWENARLVLFTLALFLLMLAARLSYRFGPPIPDLPRRKRSLIEHVNGSGVFLWRHGHADQLITATRAALEQTLEKRYAGWRHLSAADQLHLLAELVGVAPEWIHETLHKRDVQHRREFTQIIQRLSLIRKKL